MARATVLSSYIWGIDAGIVIEGDGYGSGPSVSMVAVGDPNTVRVVFDRAMMQDGYLLDTDNYSVAETGNPSSTLAVFRALPVVGRQDAVDLVTQDQAAVGYDFLAGAAGANAPIRDAYGNTLVSGSANFAGQAPASVAYSSLHMFSGFEAGMDAKTEASWDPDLDPPYLAHLDPADGYVNVDASTHINLDILDDTSGVNDLAVRIRVDGAYAWLLGSAQPGFTVFRSTVPKGFRYDVHRSLTFGPLQSVLVEVYAEDLAAIPNILSTSYSFTTIGSSHAPFLRNLDPGAEVGGVPPQYSYSFDLLDDYDDVNPATILLYVNGSLAYSGAAELWYAPYDGYVGHVENVDGYDGYHVRIDHPAFPNSSRVDIRVVASDFQMSGMDQTYGFWIAPAALQPLIDPYEITLRLPFSGGMDPAAVLDASLFRLSGGAYVRKVDILSPTEVRLWVERLLGQGPFTLTVSALVADAHGGHLVGDQALSVPVFQSAAFFSNTDGLLRSWHESRLVARDAQRAYFAGIRGIDVLDIRSGITAANRWAQVLDIHGIGAMCLLGSADGYDFADEAPPRLANQDPAPDATGVPADTDILFSVVEGITAVETVSLAVYVNGAIAFSGAGGWAGNWGGQITVRPQALDVALFPPEPFAPSSRVEMRVLASDLLGNRFDGTYVFTTAA